MSGPKTKCIKCDSICYLRCFGFEAGTKVEDQETIKYPLPNGTIFSAYLSCMAFSCCSDIMTANEQRSALKLPTAQMKGNVTESMIVQLKETISEHESTIGKLQSELKGQSEVIQQLADKNDNPEQFTESDANLLGKIKEMISNEMAKVSETIATECKKVKKFCTKKLSEHEDKGISETLPQKPNPFNKATEKKMAM